MTLFLGASLLGVGIVVAPGEDESSHRQGARTKRGVAQLFSSTFDGDYEGDQRTIIGNA